jgi:hypothetical protein
LFRVDKIKISENRKLISYSYSMNSNVEKFFNKNKPFYVNYDNDISTTPASIAIIPLLANIVPISWFVGFNVYVDEVDESFFHCLKKIKNDLSRFHPEYEFKGEIVANRLVKNVINGQNSAMLFSGGVDSYASFIKHIDDNLTLFTLRGADMVLDDQEQWDGLMQYNSRENLIAKNAKYYIESNLREFYTYRVDLLVENGWWGKVQHGLGMLGLLAPSSFINNINNIFIASSYSKHDDDELNGGWGSTPQIDEQIRWANISIINDGFDLERQEKIKLLVNYSKKSNNRITLRVCYSEIKRDLNCSRCEKCYRTIVGIILEGGDPNAYGFRVNENIYIQMFEDFRESRNNIHIFFWHELMERAKLANTFFVFKDKKTEGNYIKQIADGEIQRIIYKGLDKIFIKGRTKFILRSKFPFFYKCYRIMRYGLL